MNGKPRQNFLFHVGRPDAEKPHADFSMCARLHEKHPQVKLVVFLWDEKDAAEVKARLDPEKAEVVLWQSDGQLMSWLMDRIGAIVGVEVQTPKWYTCTEKHVTGARKHTLVTECASCKQPMMEATPMLEKCPTCGNGVAMTLAYPEKFERFAFIFANVVNLVAFDTTSGDYLHAAVNPTENFMRNMPAALGCEHAKALQARELRDTWKGKPSVVIGAGPSLADAIPHLLRIQDKVKISCVGRCYKMLVAKGLRIDYAFSCEMFDWDSAIFDGLAYVGDTILAYADVCAPATVAKWPGRKVCLWNVESGKMLKRDDTILGGNSIAHHMLNFSAEILGAEPIILVGVDLAYVLPQTHVDGSAPDAWPEEVKTKDREYHAEDWGPCTGKGHIFHPECHKMLTALGGGKFVVSGNVIVRTSPAYKNFGTLFEILISKHGKRVLNACPNGLKIDGTEYVDLATYEP